LSEKKVYPTIILGAGLSGLATAFYLKKKGEDFLILEKSNRAGGVIESFKKGNSLFDKAAISFSLTPEIQEIVEALGLKDQMLFPKEESKMRFIYSKGRLKGLKQSPFSIFTSSILSWKGKMRLLREQKISSKSSKDESVANFIRRRFGSEVYDKIGNAVLSGIYAGDPEKMEAAFVIKRFVEMEKKYGSLISGMRASSAADRKANNGKNKRISVSFANGTADLTNALARHIKEEIVFNQDIRSIEKKEGLWHIQTTEDSFKTERVISCLPSYVLTQLLTMHNELKDELNKIPYSKVSLLHLSYNNHNIGEMPRGFGFLIPKIEGKAILGAVINSNVFEGRTAKGNTSLTVFIGEQNAENHDSKQIENAQKFLEETLKINGAPLDREITYWEKAIPQFHIGHTELLSKIEGLTKNENLVVSGNFVSGVSVGDVVKHAKHLATFNL